MSVLAVALAACSPTEAVSGADLTVLGRGDARFVEATWVLEGDSSDQNFGAALAPAGDVNGDGLDDLIVGSCTMGCTGPRAEEAFVYHGSPSGLEGIAAWSAEGSQPGDYWSDQFASTVASAGDVNGDGFDDVVIGAPLEDGLFSDEGAAFLYLGSAAGLSAVPAWSATGGEGGVLFGSSVAGAGDVNADGFDDVVVVAKWWGSSEGAAFLYLGSAVGLAVAPAWTALFGAGAGLEAAAGAGDVNGDGFADVVVGAPGYSGLLPREGSASLFLGSPAGLAGIPAWSALGGEADAQFGSAVASAGDVDGDGFDDVIVSNPGHSNVWPHTSGAVTLYLGSAAGLSVAPDWRATGDNYMVGPIASAGDLDGDGFDEVAVGIPFDSVYVYAGSPTGPAVTPTLVLEGAGGHTVASAGDVDGDGMDELAAGAPFDDRVKNDGGVVSVYARLLEDTDGDGAPDAGDLCPLTPDPAQRDADADGIGDACDAPSLTVVGVFSPGRPVSLVASGVAEGEVVRFGGSVGSGAAGPCPAALGGLCLGLGAAAVELGVATADAQGVATRLLTVPAAVQVDGTYTVQAAVRRGSGGVDSVASSVVVVDGASLDWDADGLADADELALGTDPTLPDSDGDGLDDSAELALGTDPRLADSDADGVVDGADLCARGDDTVDGDLDGHPDDCDRCPLDVDPAQADADADGLGDPCDGEVLVGETIGSGTQSSKVSAPRSHRLAT